MVSREFEPALYPGVLDENAEMGKTKKDHIKKKDIWGETNIDPVTTFLRKRRLSWFGHALRKEGRKEGMKEGRKEGRTEGRKEGRKEGKDTT